MLVRFGGCETNTTISHYNCRHAMPAGRRHFVVPGRLTVIVRMHINKARRHNFSRRVDLFTTLRLDLSNQCNPVAINRHIRNEGGRACTVDNCSTPNDQIMHFRSSRFSND